MKTLYFLRNWIFQQEQQISVISFLIFCYVDIRNIERAQPYAILLVYLALCLPILVYTLGLEHKSKFISTALSYKKRLISIISFTLLVFLIIYHSKLFELFGIALKINFFFGVFLFVVLLILGKILLNYYYPTIRPIPELNVKRLVFTKNEMIYYIKEENIIKYENMLVTFDENKPDVLSITDTSVDGTLDLFLKLFSHSDQIKIKELLLQKSGYYEN